jgi:hypothetical protein
MFEEPIRTSNRGVWPLVAVSSALLFVLSSAVSQTAPVERVTGKDKTIVVHERGRDHIYDFEEDLRLREIGEARLLFQNRVNGKLYLLIYVVESAGTGNGQCGGGQEEYLTWQVLDSEWAQDDHKVELIGSCALNIENQSPGPDPYEIKQGKLTSEYIDYPDNFVRRTRTLTYDSTKPEQSWIIQKKPLPANEPR